LDRHRNGQGRKSQFGIEAQLNICSRIHRWAVGFGLQGALEDRIIK